MTLRAGTLCRGLARGGTNNYCFIQKGENLMQYSEKTIYKKANEIGYSVHKGKVHFLNTNYPVFSDDVGYNVINNSLGIMVWGCYNNVLDHLWGLQDVEDFLKSEYSEMNLDY